jgi:ribosomal protein S8
MSMSDPLGDMLTRIRNGQNARKSVVSTPASRFRSNVLEVLKREGYIRNYSSVDIRPGLKELKIELKYHEGQPVISEIKRVSRPCQITRRVRQKSAAKSSATYFKERLTCLVSVTAQLPFLPV